MNALTKSSELDYLKRLKENNTKTIKGQLTMIRNRDNVISEKDQKLRDIIVLVDQIDDLIPVKLGDPLYGDVLRLTRVLKRVAEESLKVGIIVRERHHE